MKMYLKRLLYQVTFSPFLLPWILSLDFLLSSVFFQPRGLPLIFLSFVISILRLTLKAFSLTTCSKPYLTYKAHLPAIKSLTLSKNIFIGISPLKDIFFCLMQSFLSLGTYHVVGTWPQWLNMKSHHWSYCLSYVSCLPLLHPKCSLWLINGLAWFGCELFYSSH